MSTETTPPPTAQPIEIMTTKLVPNPVDNEGVANPTERLRELASKIQIAYQTAKECESTLKSWEDRRLRAGLEVGKCLREAKFLLPTGQFVRWCNESFPNLSHRTLTRYMGLAKNETHVTNYASSLRQCYRACADPKRKREPSPDSDLCRIEDLLGKAKILLNKYQNVPPSSDADNICDLLEAMHSWVTAYHERNATVTNGAMPRANRDSDLPDTNSAGESLEVTATE